MSELPLELFELHIIPNLDVVDIINLLCTNSIFKQVKWKFVLKNVYPKLYKHLFKQIDNKYTIIKTIIDYKKLFLTLHKNINILDKLKIFIKSNNKSRLDIFEKINDNIIFEILLQHVDPSVNNSYLLYNIFENKLYKLILNDTRINPTLDDNMLLYYVSMHKKFNYDILFLIMDHNNFIITEKQLYLILFHLCIDDNMNSIKLIINHDKCKLLLPLNIFNINDIVEFASEIKVHINDFDTELFSNINKAINNKNKNMVKWFFDIDNVKNIHSIYLDIITILIMDKNVEYLLLLSTFDNPYYIYDMIQLCIIENKKDLMIKLIEDSKIYNINYLDFAIQYKRVEILEYLLPYVENNNNIENIRELFKNTLIFEYNLDIIKIFLSSKSLNGNDKKIL